MTKQTMTVSPGQKDALKIMEKNSGVLVNQVVKELMAIFPAWKKEMSKAGHQAEVKKQFMKAFVESRINTYEKLNYGLKKARNHDSPYFPSVGQFVSWCQDGYLESLNIPPFEVIFREILDYRREIKNPFRKGKLFISVYAWHIYKHTQSYAWTGSENEAKRLAEKEYKQLLTKARSGFVFEVSPQ